MNFVLLIFVILCSCLIFKFFCHRFEHYYDPVSCVRAMKMMKNAIRDGELTEKQANILWISKKYDSDCGNANFCNFGNIDRTNN